MADLLTLFNPHACVKILNFLTLYHRYEYTKTDLIRETGISRRTLYEVWPKLEEFDLVEKTKKVGNAQLYKLNMKNEINKLLVKMVDKITLFSAEKIIEKDMTK